MKTEDAAALLAMNSDPEVVRFTGDAPCRTLEDAQRIITDLALPQFSKFQTGRFSVFLEDGTYVGWCGLKTFPDHDEVDLGYRFIKKYWGRGFATEAALACLKYGFEELKLKRIVARTMPDNRASIKVLQKLKMSFKGFEQDPSVSSGAFAPGFILYELTNQELTQ